MLKFRLAKFWRVYSPPVSLKAWILEPEHLDSIKALCLGSCMTLGEVNFFMLQFSHLTDGDNTNTNTYLVWLFLGL